MHVFSVCVLIPNGNSKFKLLPCTMILKQIGTDNDRGYMYYDKDDEINDICIVQCT